MIKIVYKIIKHDLMKDNICLELYKGFELICYK